MTVDDLINRAAGAGLTAEEVDACAVALGQSIASVIDTAARAIVDRFVRGEYSWAFSDAAMNGLYGFAYVASDAGLSPFAMAVYEAFDAGEIAAVGTEPDDRSRDLLRRTLLKLVATPTHLPSA